MTICTWILPLWLCPSGWVQIRAWCPGKCSAELLAQLLRPVYGQAVVRSVPWVKADDIVVAFHIFPPFLVFLIAEIGPHTGNGEILPPQFREESR